MLKLKQGFMALGADGIMRGETREIELDGKAFVDEVGEFLKKAQQDLQNNPVPEKFLVWPRDWPLPLLDDVVQET